MGTTLRYPYELRDSTEYFDDLPNVKVAPDMLKIAQHILETKEADFDPSQFVDHYEEAVVEMLKKKQAGLTTPKGKASEPPQKRIEGQREMLLPIAGKKGKEAAKPVARAATRQRKVG